MVTDKFRIYSAVILIPVLFSIGCEGETCADGIVYDAETKIPLDSVFYKSLGRYKDSAYTDTTGAYSMCGTFGGCVPDCPDLNMQFSKKGYVSQEHRNPDRKSIYMEKVQE